MLKATDVQDKQAAKHCMRDDTDPPRSAEVDRYFVKASSNCAGSNMYISK
jgi:hypothetical protein